MGNQTLLATLGFQDPDKQEPEHDLACNYLCSPNIKQAILDKYSPLILDGANMRKYALENHRLMASLGFDHRSKELDKDLAWKAIQEQLVFKDFQNTRGYFSFGKETPVSKGKDQYKKTIGFMDLYAHIHHTLRYQWFPKRKPKEALTENVVVSKAKILFEVKTHLKVSDFLRQVNLYKEYVRVQHTVLVTTKPISQYQKWALEQERVEIILLDKRFRDWRDELLSNNTGPKLFVL